MKPVGIQEIIDDTPGKYDGMVVNHNWEEKGLFYNPGNKLAKGIYILTFKEKDGPNDNASNVNRDGIYRLNLGISKDSFIALFGEIPKRPSAGKTINTGHNFQKLDTIMHHPVYGWMSWIAIHNSGKQTFEILKPLINESVKMAKIKFSKKAK